MKLLYYAALTLLSLTACRGPASKDDSAGSGATSDTSATTGPTSAPNTAGGAGTEEPAGAVPAGVYDCFGTYNIDTGKFSVIGPGQYMSRAGGTGSFSFDGNMLTMVDGPYAGIRYRKEAPEWTFRMLKEDTGEDSPFVCPRNTTKDTRDPNTW